MIERHGSPILLLAGSVLVAGGLLAASSATQIALCAIGASLWMGAVVLTKMKLVKFGPSGFEAELLRSANEKAESVARSLSASGLDDLIALVDGSVASGGIQTDQIRGAVSSLIEVLERLDAADEQGQDERVPAAALLEAAHGLMATREWASAARYFDRYVEIEPDNWDAQFSRAVAHANSRVGRESDLAALRAFSDAIALRPPLTKSNLLARLHSYRGAMLKRLQRLAEAEADLRLAEAMATETAEENDIRYNLACVMAMKGCNDEALELVRSLQGTPYIAAISAKREQYFASLADDPEFLALLSPHDG